MLNRRRYVPDADIYSIKARNSTRPTLCSGRLVTEGEQSTPGLFSIIPSSQILKEKPLKRKFEFLKNLSIELQHS